MKYQTAPNLTPVAARLITGGLSKPSKMPCSSYGLSARACITGAKMAKIKGSTCADCYALKGFYMMPSVAKAHQARMASMLNGPLWVAAMTLLISAEKSGYFRWHDSGDLQSVDHLDKILAVVKATPRIQHWLPTREFGMVRQWVDANGPLPENITVRFSALMVDQAPPTELAARVGALTSTVTTTEADATCVAPRQSGKCLDCRACWSKSVPNVAYLQH